MNLADCIDDTYSGATAVEVAPGCQAWIRPPDLGARLLAASVTDPTARRAVLAPHVLVAWEGLTVAVLCDVLGVVLDDRTAHETAAGTAAIAWSPENAVSVCVAGQRLPAALVDLLEAEALEPAADVGADLGAVGGGTTRAATTDA